MKGFGSFLFIIGVLAIVMDYANRVPRVLV